MGTPPTSPSSLDLSPIPCLLLSNLLLPHLSRMSSQWLGFTVIASGLGTLEERQERKGVLLQ